MKVHVLQHASFEGLGSIGRWLEEHAADVSWTRLFSGELLPPVGEIDMLIAMGGPMSVNDEDALPWLRGEKQFVRDTIASDRAVLGVCLGAQLIASALGARVYRNPVKEIGWFPIQAVPSPGREFRFPAESTVFHWHGETFDLPPGAVRLAKSEGCANQAFQLKHNVIGLQFHLEMTRDSALALVEQARDDLAPGPYVQAEDVLRATPPMRYEVINGLMDDVLDYLSPSIDPAG